MTGNDAFELTITEPERLGGLTAESFGYPRAQVAMEPTGTHYCTHVYATVPGAGAMTLAFERHERPSIPEPIAAAVDAFNADTEVGWARMLQGALDAELRSITESRDALDAEERLARGWAESLIRERS